MIRTLFICIALFNIYTARAEPLRVLTYNVLYGFNHGKAPEIGAKRIVGAISHSIADRTDCID